MAEQPPLGIIEGFYGPLWSWEVRRQLVAALAPHGYRNYWSAPKADAFLRRRWNEPHPQAEAGELEMEAARELERTRVQLREAQAGCRCCY